MGTALKVSVSKDELAQKLGIVSRGVSTRTAVLVLGGIQLRAEAGRLSSPGTGVSLTASRYGGTIGVPVAQRASARPRVATTVARARKRKSPGKEEVSVRGYRESSASAAASSVCSMSALVCAVERNQVPRVVTRMPRSSSARRKATCRPASAFRYSR